MSPGACCTRHIYDMHTISTFFVILRSSHDRIIFMSADRYECSTRVNPTEERVCDDVKHICAKSGLLSDRFRACHISGFFHFRHLPQLFFHDTYFSIFERRPRRV